MQNYFSNVAVLLIVSALMTSCSVITGIFKAGMGFGIFIVIVIVLLIVFVISKFMGGKK